MRRFLGTVALVLFATRAFAFEPGMRTAERVATSGRPQKIGSVIYLDPTCHSMGLGEINILEAPRNGQIFTNRGQEYPSFASVNPRSKCNVRRVPAMIVGYRSEPGFLGQDEFVIEFVGPFGVPNRIRVHMDVR